jgi:hypothetical protein
VERSSARTVQLDSEPTQSCRGSDGSFASIPVAPKATIEPRGSSLLGHSAFAIGMALLAPYLPFAVAVVIAGRQTLRLSDFERV